MRYSTDQVYNTDKTGLFCRAIPDVSLRYTTAKLKESKKAMERLTNLVCANMDCTVKKKLLVIDKAQCPRFLRAWM